MKNLKKLIRILTIFLILYDLRSALALSYSNNDIFLNEDQHTGFIDIEEGNQFFYWLFRSNSNPTEDPLVFWLSGGPGCSSEFAVFYENGPYFINENLTLSKKNYSWTNIANMVYVDHPIGTGYSTGKVLDTKETQIQVQFYDFLVGFLNLYPEYIGRKIYLSGESYAGHFIPNIASYIIMKNNPDINLKGILIIDGYVDPVMHYLSYAKYAKQNNLISSSNYKFFELAFSGCATLIDKVKWDISMPKCQNLVNVLINSREIPFNHYDIRKKCDYPPLCYNFTIIQDFLNQKHVQKALGVKGRSWQLCNDLVQQRLLPDYVTNDVYKIGYILENGVFVLIANGDKDFIINWIGSEMWVNNIPWKKNEEFVNTEYNNWGFNGKYGKYKMVDNLGFFVVHNAGHMISMDQPEATLELFDIFLNQSN